MNSTALGEDPSRQRVRLVMARRVAIAVLFVASAVLVILPSGGPAATAPARAGLAVQDPDALSRDAAAAAARNSRAVASLAGEVAAARDARDALLRELGALTGLSYRSVPQVLPADTAADLSASRTEHYADVAAGALRLKLAAAESSLTAAEQAEQQAIADYFAAVAAAADAAAAAAAAAADDEQAAAQDPPAAVDAAPPPSGGGCTGDVACFLACTRAHESDTAGGYQAVSPDGVYRGAYQFDQTTWNSIADAIGRRDLVGADPSGASPIDQDTLATALYAVRGNQPWGGRC